MFDEQMPNNQGETPKNLPIGEPVDMFADTEKPVASENLPQQPSLSPEANQHVQPQTGNSPVSPQKIVQPPTMQTPPPVSPSAGSPEPISAGGYGIKKPSIGKIIMIVILVIVFVGILLGGGWFIYVNFMKVDNSDVISENGVQELEEEPIEVDDSVDETEDSVDITQELIDDEVLFGEPIDTDGDNLDDVREVDIGTDPNNWDTDNDNLSDGDEVIIWKTNPLNPDSDGDTYLDGDEVKSGYNPMGPGRLFEPPETVLEESTSSENAEESI